MNYFDEALSVMTELYAADHAMSLATVNGGRAGVRVVNACYKDRAFYVITYALSGKMRDLAQNPSAALTHNLFVAHGEGRNIGHPLDEQNRQLREELRTVFSAFYDRHVKEDDPNTCILKITLTDAVLFAHNYKYRVDFEKQTATRQDFVVDIIF